MMISPNQLRAVMTAMALMAGIGAYQAPVAQAPRTAAREFLPASSRPTLTKQKASHLRTGVAKSRRAATKRRNIAKHS